MIKGRYGDSSGRPYIEGYLQIPFLNVDGFISFVLDTGADCTVLMPLDAKRIKLDYSKLQNVPKLSSIGFGGQSTDHILQANLIIGGVNNKAYGYQIDLRIAEPKRDIEELPSILGRNVIDRWKINYHPSAKVLETTVISADKEFDN